VAHEGMTPSNMIMNKKIAGILDYNRDFVDMLGLISKGSHESS
jgi:hypothetical protein